MTAHLTILLAAARRWAARETDVEPYVWWGKVRFGQLASVRHRGPLQKAAPAAAGERGLVVEAFPNVLAEVASLRNPGVHRAHVGREAVLGLRSPAPFTAFR